ncbi:hypothetical protein FRC07_010981 [Ceratobasidium sp. 392]|nr:hypothetical protein FRC07_010981 [Ceratobasidium sp. 392]
MQRPGPTLIKLLYPKLPGLPLQSECFTPAYENKSPGTLQFFRCLPTRSICSLGLNGSLPDEVQVFGNMMQQQIDLRHEARNLSQFEQNFGRDGLGGKSGRATAAVVFPRPLIDWSTDKALVKKYADAAPLKYFLEQGGGPFHHRIANLGLDTLLNMLLLNNFVHAPLHPGKIMIQFYKPTTKDMFYDFFSSIFNSNTPPLDGHAHLRERAHLPVKWLFLDAGLVTILSKTNRHNFLDLFRAITEFNGYRAGQLMVVRCHSPQLAVDPDIFARKMQHLVLGVKRKTFSLGYRSWCRLASSVVEKRAATRDKATIGYATISGGTTGGGFASPVTTTSLSALKSALSSGNKVVLISGTSTGNEVVKVPANTSVIGKSGAALNVVGLRGDRRLKRHHPQPQGTPQWTVQFLH